jgi:hypothetical protein
VTTSGSEAKLLCLAARSSLSCSISASVGLVNWYFVGGGAGGVWVCG